MIAIRGMVIDGFVEAWQQTFLGWRHMTSFFDEIATESTHIAYNNKNTNILIFCTFHLF
jgi:hypothetical protein